MTVTTAPASTDAAPGTPAGPGAPAKRGRPTLPARSFWLHTERYALLFAWLAVIVVFSLALPNTFFTLGNLQNVLGSQAVLLILALGLLFPLTAGEFDLSVASTLSMSSMTVAVLI